MNMLTGLAVSLVVVAFAASLAVVVLGVAHAIARRSDPESEERDEEEDDIDGGDWQPAWYGQNPATD